MDCDSGDFGVGGDRPSAARFCFRGRLGEPFVTFAMRRARRLGLDGWIEMASDDRVLVAASGPEALVNAFEMACALGPIDADIADWQREPDPGYPNHRGFLRQDR